MLRFQKLSARFQNASIFVKLLAAGLTTILSIVLMSFGIMAHFFAIHDRADRVHTLSDSLSIQLLSVRLAEKNFVRYDLQAAAFYETGTSRYLAEHDRHMAALKSKIVSLIALAAGEKRQQAQKLLALVDAYASIFSKMVDSFRQRGFKDWGFLGAQRSAIHRVERIVMQMNRFDLQEQLLQLRRMEKDYLLRGDSDYIDGMIDQMDVLRNRIRDLAPAETVDVLKALARYESAFKSFVLLGHRIGKTDRDGLQGELFGVVRKIRPLIRDVFEETRVAKQQARRNFVVVSVAVYLLGFGLAGAVFYAFSRSISSKLNALKQAALRVGRGDLETRVLSHATDEIGIVADAFNKMAADLNRITVSKQYVDQIIASMADMLIVVSPGMVIRTVNRAALEALGYRKEELLGRPADTVIDRWEAGNRLVRDLLSNGFVRNVEKTLRRKDGRRLPVLFSGSTMSDRHGAVSGIVCVAQDITERKRTEEMLKRSERQLRLVSAKTLDAQEQERKRVARELHDGIGQALSGIKYCLENGMRKLRTGAPVASVAELGETVSLLQATVEETRRISMGLRPSTLDDIGICETVFWFCSQFEGIYSNIRVEPHLAVDEDSLSEPVKTAIFRVMQEALNNVAKHSRAGRATVRLLEKDHRVELIVTDDGIGFVVDALLLDTGPERGFGLASMKERTELSGGRFSLQSAPGRGTTVTAVWPLRG